MYYHSTTYLKWRRSYSVGDTEDKCSNQKSSQYKGVSGVLGMVQALATVAREYVKEDPKRWSTEVREEAEGVKSAGLW